MKITLIGMPGSGKSTIGELLAQTLGIDYVDLDELIESHQNLTIAEIFKLRGEPAFRQLESKLLYQVLEKDSNIVLASGGGSPCFHDGINIINAGSSSVYLETSINTLKSNLVRSQESRPLLIGELRDKLDDLLKRRTKIYEKANLIVKTDGHLPITICQNIISKLDLA